MNITGRKSPAVNALPRRSARSATVPRWKIGFPHAFRTRRRAERTVEIGGFFRESPTLRTQAVPPRKERGRGQNSVKARPITPKAEGSEEHPCAPAQSTQTLGRRIHQPREQEAACRMAQQRLPQTTSHLLAKRPPEHSRSSLQCSRPCTFYTDGPHQKSSERQP